MLGWFQRSAVRCLVAVCAILVLGVATFERPVSPYAGRLKAEAACVACSPGPEHVRLGDHDGSPARDHVAGDHTHVAFGLPPESPKLGTEDFRRAAWPQLSIFGMQVGVRGPDRPPKSFVA